MITVVVIVVLAIRAATETNTRGVWVHIVVVLVVRSVIIRRGRRCPKEWKVWSITILLPNGIVIVFAVWTSTRTITPGVGVGVLFIVHVPRGVLVIVHVLVATGAVDGRWGRWRWSCGRKRHVGAGVGWTTPRIETIRIIIPVGVGIIVPIIVGG
jgi:hypothetical protein